MLNLQTYLRNGKTIQDLKDELFIKVNETDELALFTYDQIDSPKTHPIVMECRGIVLEKGTWNIVYIPFRRFFNYGECPNETMNFNFEKAVVLEKVDGSMCGVWCYKGTWHMSTRGTIDGTGQVGFTEMTFKQLFDATVAEFYPEFWKRIKLSPNVCYTFELVSPENRVVTLYEQRALYLLGARFIGNEEMDCQDNAELVDLAKTMGANLLPQNKEIGRCALEILAKEFGVRIPKKFNANNLAELKAYFETMNSFDEGFVCVDYTTTIDGLHFPRVKCKNPKYLAIAHLKDSATSSMRGLMVLVIKNDYEELIVNFPIYKQYVDKLKTAYDAYLVAVNATWDKIKVKEFASQKEFALEAIKTPFSSILFDLRKNKGMTVKDWFTAQNAKVGEKIFAKKMLEWVKMEDVEFGGKE